MSYYAEQIKMSIIFCNNYSILTKCNIIISNLIQYLKIFLKDKKRTII
jgi:hypothetical protein